MLRKNKRGDWMTHLADMHVHSINSHDATIPVLDMVRAEIDAGIRTMAIADHWDGFRCLDTFEQDLFGHIEACWQDVQAVRAQLGDQCELLMSIELGEPHWDYAQSEKALSLVPYDSVIGSVHAVRCPEIEGCVGLKRAFSQMDFKAMSDEAIDRFFRLYFEEVLTMVKTVDMDILAHLTCPFDVVFSRTKVVWDSRNYGAAIDEILRVIIDRGIALELNSGALDSIGRLTPEPWIVARYLELGGNRITLGADAHWCHEAGRGMLRAVEVLKELGVTEAYYLKERRFYAYTL